MLGRGRRFFYNGIMDRRDVTHHKSYQDNENHDQPLSEHLIPTRCDPSVFYSGSLTQGTL